MNNILVVDDEREIADVIELYLQSDQYRIFKFYTEMCISDREKMERQFIIII